MIESKEGEAMEVENKQQADDVEDGPPSGWQSIPLPLPLPLPQPSPPPPPSSEMAQMVCGSCRTLLSYPRGARHVQCSSCQMVNFVLEGAQQEATMVCNPGTPSKSYSLSGLHGIIILTVRVEGCSGICMSYAIIYLDKQTSGDAIAIYIMKLVWSSLGERSFSHSPFFYQIQAC
ncbi:protein LOL2 isoform X1 [Ricinus communis]|uniref:protein LOL2 isoform X1 n=1 Tax=Ricinus communis TaxID=3988 RepID=UPI00201B010C|nr:protein LOL2 isoform X1 [Ricinus communis]